MVGGPVRGGTPWNRIAVIARQLLVETLTVDGQEPGARRPHPYVPDTADFADAIRQQMEWELILAQIEECKACGAPKERMALLEAREMAIRNRMNMP